MRKIELCFSKLKHPPYPLQRGNFEGNPSKGEFWKKPFKGGILEETLR
jgi:hypothetical protein